MTMCVSRPTPCSSLSAAKPGRFQGSSEVLRRTATRSDVSLRHYAFGTEEPHVLSHGMLTHKPGRGLLQTGWTCDAKEECSRLKS